MKSCKKGYYYCHSDKKCKKIPIGYYVSNSGWLRKEDTKEEEEKKNGNHKNGDGSGNGGSDGSSNGGSVSENTLHQWFKGSKSKDGKPGWVNVVTGGTCASDEPGEGTPKCVSSAKRASMSKAERLSAARRKKRADPRQQQKTDAAKPTYVSTDKEKMKRESYSNWRQELEEQIGVPTGPGTKHPKDTPDSLLKKMLPGEKIIPSKPLKLAHYGAENEMIAGRGDGGSPYEPYKGPDKKGPYVPAPPRPKPTKLATKTSKTISAHYEPEGKIIEGYVSVEDGVMYLEGNQGPSTPVRIYTFPDGSKRVQPYVGGGGAVPRKGYVKKETKPTTQVASFEPEGELVDEGKKDACYHKVKSRYSVWPSAYASGALVKCRKVGAKNWGNKTNKEGYEFSNWRDDFKAMEIEVTDLIKPEPIKGLNEGIPGYEKYDAAMNALRKKKSTGELSDKEFIKALLSAGALRPKTVKENQSELGEDWQKVNKKDKTDGMSAAAVKAYRRENPGSELKTAVTGDPKPGSKDAKRRKSFCARSKGQQDMHNIDCSKTPDKPVCKARRRWKC